MFGCYLLPHYLCSTKTDSMGSLYKYTAWILLMVLAAAVTIILSGVRMCTGSTRSTPFDDKGYNQTLIRLPEVKTVGEMSVEQALLQRRSVRQYSNEALSLQTAGQLLWAAYGISDSSGGVLRHTAPSAGALYPLEIYLVAGNVEGLAPGIYKYLPQWHALSPLITGDVRKDLARASFGQKMIEAAPCSIVFTAVFKRTEKKYGQRGRERYVCMDLGHAAENVYLQATAMGCGTCAVGAFTDQEVSRVMQLRSEEDPLYILPVGKIIR